MEPAPASETAPPRRRNGKSASAFRTISEVAGELDLPQHVLRFWETKFQNVRPLKRGGGRRYYRPEDVTLLKQIRDLLYNDGYTIKGVQKLFREGSGKTTPGAQPTQPTQSLPPEAQQADALGGDVRTELRAVLGELEDLRGLLKSS
jgi:DNA-binding transcriptional MerR regulator